LLRQGVDGHAIAEIPAVQDVGSTESGIVELIVDGRH